MHTSQPAVILFTAAEVAKIAGIDESAVKGLEPDYFGSPGHWRMVGNNVVYTGKAVTDLAHALNRLGNLVAAQSLLVELKAREETPSRDLLPAARKSAEPYYSKGQYA